MQDQIKGKSASLAPIKFRHDVFLSHSSKDRPQMRKIAARLEDDGLSVWFDEREIKPTDVIEKRIEEGLAGSRVLVLAISKDALGSDWSRLESGTFRFRDSANKERRFVPIRLDETEMPDALKKFAYVDWRSPSEEQYKRLLAASKRPPLPPISKEERRGVVSCKVLEVLVQQPTCIAVTSKGRYAFSGTLNGFIRRWDLHTRKCVGDYGEQGPPLDGLSVSLDGTRAVSGRYDGALCVWNLKDGNLLYAFKAHSGYVRTTGITADGKKAISGSSDGTVRVWDLNKGQLIVELTGHGDQINGVAIAADGTRAITGSRNYELCVYDLGKAVTKRSLQGHTRDISAVAITHDGKQAVSASADKTLRVWNLQAGKLVATLEGHTNSIACLAVSADGKTAVSSSGNTQIRVWDLNIQMPTDEGMCFSILGLISSAVLIVCDLYTISLN